MVNIIDNGSPCETHDREYCKTFLSKHYTTGKISSLKIVLLNFLKNISFNLILPYLHDFLMHRIKKIQRG